MLIVLEGIDGTGKSTLAHHLARILTETLDRKVVTTAQPSHQGAGKRLRESLTNNLLTPVDEINLFHLDRIQHIQTVIAPALVAGSIVICHRYYYSTMAYQGARGADPEIIRELNQAFSPEPDLVFLLTLPPAEAIRRITFGRGDEPNHFEKSEFLQACHEIFQTLPSPERPHIHPVDATLPAHSLTALCGHIITDTLRIPR
jgi:dTMP kinase